MKTNVRRNSLHRRNNCANAKKRANQRAAKERRRIDRATAPYDFAPQLADAARVSVISTRGVGRSNLPLRFRVTIECLNDKARATFTTTEGAHGLTLSATACGERVAQVILHYRPARLGIRL